MNWKLKSLIQNLISVLPNKIGDSLYFKIQKNFGGLKDKHIFNYAKFNATVILWNQIQNTQSNPKDKVFFEIGTGRIPEIPLYLWLFGAKKIITVDLNPIFDIELSHKFIDLLIKNKKEILSISKGLININRLHLLENFSKDLKTFSSFKKKLNIDYISPFDAGQETIADKYIDYFFSYTVLEHIPEHSIKKIFTAIKPKMHEESLMIHFIDYSDHFSHSDPSISNINFLKYGNFYWNLIAGNKYMYMNRLRHDDFLKIFANLKLKLISIDPIFSKESFALIKENKINIHNIFNSKSNQVKATIGSWFILK